MKIFLAGRVGKEIPKEFLTYKAPFILQTYYDMQYWDDTLMQTVLETPKMFLCDSGAFSFMNSGKKVDWTKYVNNYCAFINKWDIKYFFELDLDTIIGVENTAMIRAYIKEQTGKQPIPVFHACRGMEAYRKMCCEYSYVAIGASGITEECRWVKNDTLLKKMVSIAHNYGAKIHGLGYTRLSNINDIKIPFDSVDSTACLSGGRFAKVYKFDGKRLITASVKGKSAGYKILNDHNIQEWIKMARYREELDEG